MDKWPKLDESRENYVFHDWRETSPFNIVDDRQRKEKNC